MIEASPSSSKRGLAFAAIRWTSMAMVSRAIIAMAQIVILSRILDPADFRLVAIAVTIVNTGIVFTDMGLSNAVIRFREISDIQLSSLFWLNLALGASITLVVAAGSPFIAHFYGDARLEALVLLASTVFVVTSLGQQQRALAEKTLRFDALFWIEICGASAGFVVASSAAVFGLGAISIVMGNVASSAIISGLSWVRLSGGWRPSFVFRHQDVKDFITFGSNVVGVSLFNALALNADVFLGARFITGPALGYYFQPRDICMRVMFVVNPIVTRVSFPLLASIADDKARVRTVYHKALNMTASVNFPVYGFIALFAPEVVAIVLGPKWVASIEITRMVAVWCAVRSVGNPVGSLLFALGETRRASASALGVAAAVAAFVVNGAQFGVIGVPIALIFLYLLLIPGFWLWLVRPACGSSFVSYHAALLWPALSTACAVITCTAALSVLNGLFARLILGGLAGALGYIAGSWIFNREWLVAMSDLLMLERLRRARFA